MSTLSIVSSTPSNVPEPRAQVRAAFERLASGFRSEPYPSARVREDRLERLERALQRRADEIITAIDEDFRGRARLETLSADLVLPLQAIRHARQHLREWMRPERRNPVWYLRPSTARVEYQPKGVVGVLAPWNYPVNLTVVPLAEAMAAGNRVLVKPSELTPRTSDVLASLLRESFAADEVGVVIGGPDAARAVTELPLDHLIFTGSTRVGRDVARAAADGLVPTTLELGGKSPAVIHPSYPLARAAGRIAFGKLYNAGQTCVAPDYVLLQAGREEQFVQAFRAYVEKGWGDLASSPDYSAIISERHRDRLEAMLQDAEAKGARIVRVDPRGTLAARQPRMAPALVLDARPGMTVMEEEIFGPILPVVGTTSVEASMAFINARPRPLALYYFDDDSTRAEDILQRTTSGGVCLNDTLLHFTNEELPFGGIGPSGMGAYHGREGFLTFSHAKAVFVASRLSGLLSPPYPAVLERALRAMVGGKPRRPGS